MTFYEDEDHIYIDTEEGRMPVIGAHIYREGSEFAIITSGAVFTPCRAEDVDLYRDILDRRGR